VLRPAVDGRTRRGMEERVVYVCVCKPVGANPFDKPPYVRAKPSELRLFTMHDVKIKRELQASLCCLKPREIANLSSFSLSRATRNQISLRTRKQIEYCLQTVLGPCKGQPRSLGTPRACLRRRVVILVSGDAAAVCRQTTYTVQYMVSGTALQ